MGLIYEPNSLAERRMEYERKRREEAEREAVWETERLQPRGEKGLTLEKARTGA